MTPKEMLAEMFRLQQKLNDETNGEGWEKGYNKHGRIINWNRCIYMECAELIDSFNWKHWKDINIMPDWDNITIELVDIWHFVMSLGLEYYYNEKLGTIDDIVNELLDSQYFDPFCLEPVIPDNEDAMLIVSVIEHFMKDALEAKPFYKLSDDFFETCLQCGVNIDILYKYYVAKNVLNKFRQDNGYKEGTYKKVWNGKEDNVVLSEMLEGKPMGIDALYDALEKEYRQLS
jgi:dimeric dUTPase (all-alpha-NTP-PPase superfamily)